MDHTRDVFGEGNLYEKNLHREPHQMWKLTWTRFILCKFRDVLELCHVCWLLSSTSTLLTCCDSETECVIAFKESDSEDENDEEEEAREHEQYHYIIQ